MTRATTTTLLFTLLVALLAAPAYAATAMETMRSAFCASKELSITPEIIAAVTIVVGLLVCFAGYWFIRVLFFACGFAIGAVATASAIEHVFKDQSWIEMASWTGFVLGGVVFGIMVLSLHSLSLFIVGAAGGALIAIAILLALGYRLDDERAVSVLYLMVVLVVSIATGVLTLVFEKPVIIIMTSFVGALAVAWGIGFFAGGLPSSSQISEAVLDSGSQLKNAVLNSTGSGEADNAIEVPDLESVPSAWWAYFAGIIVLFLAGAIVQFHMTRKSDSKKDRRKVKKRRQPTAPQPATPPAQTGRATIVYEYDTHQPTDDRTKRNPPRLIQERVVLPPPPPPQTQRRSPEAPAGQPRRGLFRNPFSRPARHENEPRQVQWVEQPVQRLSETPVATSESHGGGQLRQSPGGRWYVSRPPAVPISQATWGRRAAQDHHSPC